MRELITQITGMVIGSSILSLFSVRSGKAKVSINIPRSKREEMRVILVAVCFLAIVGLAVYEMVYNVL